MSAEANTKSHGKAKASQKDKERRTSQSSATVERLKVVVRRLPPNLPENVFWQSVQPWVSDETVTWRTFHPGKFRKRLNKENIPSRAYVAFKSDEQLATFAREYDGHLFKDKAGNESQAVVEFAPYQKVPAEKKKADARIGTIEKDEDYISFLESLNSAANNAETPSMEVLIAALQPPVPPKSTPLLEALKAEKTAQRDKEAILRNHAHYKDGAPPPNVLKKEETKKKGGAAPPASKQQEPPHLSKKAAKKAAAAQRAAVVQMQAAAAATTAPTPATAAGPSKNAGSSERGPGAGPKPGTPKAPRAMREQLARQQAAKAAMAATVSAQPNATAAAAATSSTGPTTNSQQQPPAAPAPRRSRPVIAAVSRQFEAALSGAGVAVGQPGGERKSRRERERERNKDKDKDNRQTGGLYAAAEKAPVESTDDNPGAGAGASADSSKAKITGILQRPDAVPLTILQRDGQDQAAQSTASSGDAAPVGPDNAASAAAAPREPVPTRGFGRRGRGRGRGGRYAGS